MNAINCSMHSQDLYYDFLCAKRVIEKTAQFKRCFIVFGYYIAYQDLSLSQGLRNSAIAPVYYPIFGDAHNWAAPVAVDIWKDFKELPEKQSRSMIRGRAKGFVRKLLIMRASNAGNLFLTLEGVHGRSCRRKLRTNTQGKGQKVITAF